VETHWKFENAEHAGKTANPGLDWIVIAEADKQYVRENLMKGVFEQVNN